MNPPSEDNSNTHVLIVGSDSLIGGALGVHLQSLGYSLLKTSRRKDQINDSLIYLDLEDDDCSLRLDNLEDLDVCFICGAFNSLDYCHRHPEKTTLVNVHNTFKIAEQLVKKGVFVVFLSTNLVYDGSKAFVKNSELVSPRTEHGRQKAEAERRLLALGDGVSVIRLTKIFGPEMHLLQSWISDLQQNKPIHPFLDKVVSPIALPFAIGVFTQVIEARVPGVIQVSGEKDITYADLAVQLARQLDVDSALVQPVTSGQSKIFIEHQPRHTTMDTSCLQNSLSIKIPPMNDALRIIIEQNIMAWQQTTGAVK